MADLPCAVFAGCPELQAKYVIEKVCDTEDLDGNEFYSNITAYKWHIDNKYYSADINLCALNSKCIGDITFARSVEAVVVCFDSSSATGLEYAESWLPFLEVYDADIKILVCNRCNDEDCVSRQTVLEWCIQKGFELVELDPNTDNFDPEDDFPETLGVERIRQALQAHQWPNLVLKSERGNSTGVPSALVESLEELLESDNFGDLFSQLSDMKQRVANLSGTDKKVAAEQVVMAFWKAVGGDDDELDDL